MCLRCSDPAVPLGPENLILKAAAAFRSRLGRAAYFEFNLDKRIPMSAGLGGGSGNAAVALRGMNQLSGEPFTQPSIVRTRRADWALTVRFLLRGSLRWMRGRGEVIEPLAAEVAERLRGTRLVLFRPDFGVETAGAYGPLSGRCAQTVMSRKQRAWLESSVLSKVARWANCCLIHSRLQSAVNMWRFRPCWRNCGRQAWSA